MRVGVFVLVLLLPMAAATQAYSGSVTTTPVTRDYLDPLTSLVYHYDASTGALTPTGESGLPDMNLYVALDVHPRGTFAHPSTATPVNCDANYCVTTLVALVGSHAVRLVVTDTPFDCRPLVLEDTANPLGVVTYYQAAWGVQYCAPGRACAQILVDGAVRAADCSAY